MKERISLNVRLFLVTMCIAVPVIAALLFTGIRERESARNEKINQLQSDVEIEMSGIDTQLKFLRNSLINLVMDDGDFRHIASAKEKDSEFWLANQRVLEKINSQTADMDSGFTVFVYYPENDVFYNYMKDIQVSDFVKEQCKAKITYPGLASGVQYGAAKKLIYFSCWITTIIILVPGVLTKILQQICSKAPGISKMEKAQKNI